MLQDLKYGARMLLRKPAFTFVVVLTLALGVGANTAIFSVADRLLLRTLPVSNPERLVMLTSVSVNPYFVSNSFSYPNYRDYRDQNNSFAGLAAFSSTDLELNLNNSTQRIRSEFVSASYFETLGIQPASGRLLSSQEETAPGTQPVVVVSDKFRRRNFADAANPIGQTIKLNDVSLTIVGVTPREFNGLTLELPTEIWVPLLMHPQIADSKSVEKRGDSFLQLIGRLKPEVSQAQAESSLDLLAQQIKEANTPAGTITKGLPFSEQHIKFQPGGQGISVLRKRFSAPLKLLMGVVGLIMLIACANVAGLLLARGVARRKEMAVRLSLGASRWRVARQLIIESLLLATISGAAGVLVAPWIVVLLIKTQSQLDLASTLLGQGIDRRVLLFGLVVTTLSAMIFAVFPAWQSSRSELVSALKDQGATRLGRFNFRSLLVVTQLALAIVVLIAAGLLVKSLRNLISIDPGYKTENLVVAPLQLDKRKFDEARGRAFQSQVFEKLSAMPEVESMSYASALPFDGSSSMSSLFVEGAQPGPSNQAAFDTSAVGPRYHETMGVQFVAGRGFTDQDREDASRVVIINEALAKQLFPGKNALGMRVGTSTNGPWMEVVGITRDVKHHDLTEPTVPHFDLPSLQRRYTSYTNIVLRTRGDADALIPTVRAQLLQLDSTLPVRGISSMSGQIAQTLAATRLASTLIAIFGVMAMLLACVGLYGVMAWMVGLRTREVGIRVALGAQRWNVLSLILKQGVVLVLSGVLLGAVVALGVTRLIDAQQLYEVSARDPFTFVVIALGLSVVALVACYIPARRATKVDPLVALRNE